MHRWFRFSTTIALVLFSLNSAAEASSAQATIPSKNKPKTSLLANLEELVELQTKQTEELGRKIDAQNAALGEQAKSIEQQGKVIEQQNGKIEALSEQITQLTAALKERRAVPHSTPAAEPVAPAPERMPTVTTGTPPPTVETAPTPPSPPTFDPNAPPQASHVVKRGENLTSIARQHGTTVAELLKVNKIEDERKLQIGQTLILPTPGSTPSATPSPQP